MGDPAGVGGEVLVRALADRDRRSKARYMIHGSSHAMHQAADAVGVEPFWWRVDGRSAMASTADLHDVVLLDSDPQLIDEGVDVRFRSSATKLGGRLSFEWVERAIADTKRAHDDPRRADAIVTGPINKQAWALAGKKRYPGHTELLTQLATVHIPLFEIRDKLTIGAVHSAIDLGHQACLGLGFARPRIAVCGLNPHAGEDGLMGDEEGRIISPAIEHAVNSGIVASGPYPADTIFNAAVEGKFDLVVAMYHDQGLIPVKLLERDLAVNVTLGLPTVRTSPDHGTAFDIAGQGIADAGSMCNAIDLAVKMAANARSVQVIE